MGEVVAVPLSGISVNLAVAISGRRVVCVGHGKRDRRLGQLGCPATVLPQGWAEQAHASGALRRARKTRKAAIDGPGRGLDRLVVALANLLQNAAHLNFGLAKLARSTGVSPVETGALGSGAHGQDARATAAPTDLHKGTKKWPKNGRETVRIFLQKNRYPSDNKWLSCG